MSDRPDVGIWRVIAVIATIIPLGVLSVAVLAGQGLFVDTSAFTLHAAIGHTLTLLAVLVVTFLWLLRAYRYALLATLQAVLLVAQTGLGYAGRRGSIGIASALHIPVGVATFGLSLLLAAWLMQHQRQLRLTAHDPQA